jgi:hypothetical protein
MSSSRHDRVNLKPGIYFGAGISALLLLLPYLGTLFVPAFILGPIAGVWFEIWRNRCRLNVTQGALIGFQSAFYGAIAAIAADQIASRIFHEQLWRLDKLYQLPPLIAGSGLNSDTPAGWYLLMFQVVLLAIFAGAIGAPSGILAVKFFQRSTRLG